MRIIISWSTWLLVGVTISRHTVHCSSCTFKQDVPLEKGDYICEIYPVDIEATCQHSVDFIPGICNWVTERGTVIGGAGDYHRYIINVREARDVDLFPGDVQYYKALTLESGDLTTVPEKIQKMRRLKSMTITANKLSTINITLYRVLKYTLTKINLSNNIISSIIPDSDHTWECCITDFDLSNNHISVLPDRFLKQFTKLQHLNMSHNTIGSMNMHTFEGLAQLKSLDLSYNQLHEIGFTFIVFRNLQELLLSNNNITEIMYYNFITLTTLEKLDISSNSISAIATNLTFRNLVKLELLDLHNNKLDNAALQHFINNTSFPRVKVSIKYVENLHI